MIRFIVSLLLLVLVTTSARAPAQVPNVSFQGASVVEVIDFNGPALLVIWASGKPRMQFEEPLPPYEGISLAAIAVAALDPSLSTCPEQSLRAWDWSYTYPQHLGWMRYGELLNTSPSPVAGFGWSEQRHQIERWTRFDISYVVAVGYPPCQQSGWPWITAVVFRFSLQ